MSVGISKCRCAPQAADGGRCQGAGRCRTSTADPNQPTTGRNQPPAAPVSFAKDFPRFADVSAAPERRRLVDAGDVGRLLQRTRQPPGLADGVVRLRPWLLEDVECVRLASTDPRIPAGTTVPAQYSRPAARCFIERQWGRYTNGEALSLAIEAAAHSRAVGLIVALLRPQPGVVGLGYWVVPPARGNGYAQRAVEMLSRWLLHTGSATRVEALVEPDNLPSRRTLEQSAFQQEGVLRSYLDGARDVVKYSLVSRDLVQKRP